MPPPTLTTQIMKRGPYGSAGGSVKEMDLTGIIRIVKISIYHSKVIDSLTVNFEHNGIKKCTDRWGGDGGNLTEINLKTDEYIKSVEGYFNADYNGHEVVMSLTLETNLAVYGPYGTKKGNKFEFRAPTYSQIIGFHAHCGKYVNAFGVYVQTTPYIKKKEPFGSLGGSVQEMDFTGITRIVKISIYHSEVIDSLAICFERNGLTQCTNRWGGYGGNITEINLKTDEYIKTVKGFFNDDYNGHEVVMSLTLKTNLAVYGPYGTEEGKKFKLRAPTYSQMIIGFHARCEKYINAVGIYVQSTGHIIKKGEFDYADMQEKEMDHTDITRIVKIIIYHHDYINGLIVYFERNDTTQCTYRWGGISYRGYTSEVKFETNEYITSVNGHVDTDYHNSICVVRSLVLKTNLRMYGPYGGEYYLHDWKPFEFSAPLGGQIIGFHGYYSDNYVHALGVYVRQSDSTIIKNGPFLGDGGIVKHMDPTCLTRIIKTRIYHADKIYGLTVYFEHNGTTQCTGLWGKNEGKLDEINFKTNEYIKSVKGYRDSSILRSLVLETNLNVYGPYGMEQGESFEHTSLHGQIISFFASVGINHVIDLGVHIKPLPISKSVPCGGSGGSARDMDDVSAISRICNVKIRYDDTIHALSVRYEPNNLFGLKETPLWGRETGKLTEIDFHDYEYIKSVRGYVGYFDDIFTVRSLELITDLRCFGPYGKEEGTPFELSAFGGRIIGFHGRSGAYLDAIGVYVQINFHGDEYIKSVRGYVGYFGDIFTVRSLQLITNWRCHGPYGKEEGTPFELSAFDGKIIGFHGRSEEYLNAIGVYVEWHDD